MSASDPGRRGGKLEEGRKGEKEGSWKRQPAGARGKMARCGRSPLFRASRPFPTLFRP
jgi:hypothetical protein